MLQNFRPPTTYEPYAAEAPATSAAELYSATGDFLRRQGGVIAAVTALALVAGCLYASLAPPRYSGQAVLLIDTHKNQVFEPQQSPLGDLPIDSATVDTQIEVLKSERIALAVIQKLRLDLDPEFNAPSPGVVGFVLSHILSLLPSEAPKGTAPSADFQRTRIALATFESDLSVKRTGLTYTIEIDFRSRDPDRAAEAANAIANAYVADTLSAKFDDTRRAADWLQQQLKGLRDDASSAEQAVVEFRAKNNLVDTGGELLNEQQLTSLDKTLVDDRAQTAEAKARLDRVQHILDAQDPDLAGSEAATVTDSLHDDVVTKLRQQYLEYSARLADWTVRYGAQHLAVINIRNQMQLLRGSINDELRRIGETYKSEYEIAKAREDSVQKSLDELVATSHTANQAQVALHGLESSAETYRSLYDSFLQHYTESTQQASFPVTNARLITEATRPLRKSSPNAVLALALSLIGGLAAGGAIGAVREISDRAVRTTGQVESRLQTECIGVLPVTRNAEESRFLAYDLGEAADSKKVQHDPNLLWRAGDTPLSRFAETIRAVKVAADLNGPGKRCKVIGVTSALPNEGKSTVALALAQTIALGGARVALLDCDLRNSNLSNLLAPTADLGVLDAAFGRAGVSEVLWSDPASNFTFVPAGTSDPLPQSSELLGCEEMRGLFEALRGSYDYVVVDLAPLAPVVDARVATRLVDTFVMVVEWGRTSLDVAEHALRRARGVHDNLLGVVLNKVDMKAFGRYETIHKGYYDDRVVARYGYTA
jgi:succinoglycan biosynthesis transport protein ExoP